MKPPDCEEQAERRRAELAEVLRAPWPDTFDEFQRPAPADVVDGLGRRSRITPTGVVVLGGEREE